MKPMASRLSRIQPSATLGVAAKAKALRAKGIDVADLSAGEPDFDTPEHIKQAAAEALYKGFTKYTPVGGIPELKDAIRERFRKDYGLDYQPGEILVSVGAKHSLFNLTQALIEEGDEVVIPAPYWTSYPDQILLAGGVPRIVPTTEADGFRMSAQAFRAAITPKTKALVLNSPSNPTGAVYRETDLKEIARIAVEADLYVISDDIYDKIVYDGFRPVEIATFGSEIRSRTIVVNGVSKSYSMTGWRIGYAAGPKEIIAAMEKLQSQSTSNPTSFVQKGVVAALNGEDTATLSMVREFQKRRDRIVDLLCAIEGITCFKPPGAFYVFPRLAHYHGRRFQGKEIRGSLDLAAYLLEEGRVAVVPGEAFGADAHQRLSYATSIDRIEEGVRRIAEALKRLA